MDAEEADCREAAGACESDGDAPAAGSAADCASAGSGDKGGHVNGKTPPFDGLGSRIDALKREQAELLAKKKQCMKDLKNAERRRRRLKKKARNLSVDDLKQLLDMRGPVDTEEPTIPVTPIAPGQKKPKKSQEQVNV